MLKVRLKRQFGGYLILTSSSKSFNICKGALDPLGFNATAQDYEKHLKPYVDVVIEVPKEPEVKIGLDAKKSDKPLGVRTSLKGSEV
jgi:hypothetical protein